MNNRIQQLARVAGLIAPHGSDREGLRDFDYRMFARLIVRECGEWVNDNVGLLDEEARADLLKHFGIEE